MVEEQSLWNIKLESKLFHLIRYHKPSGINSITEKLLYKITDIQVFEMQIHLITTTLTYVLFEFICAFKF